MRYNFIPEFNTSKGNLALNRKMMNCVVLFLAVVGSAELTLGQNRYQHSSVNHYQNHNPYAVHHVSRSNPLTDVIKNTIMNRFKQLPDPFPFPDDRAAGKIGNITYVIQGYGISFSGLSQVVVTDFDVISMHSAKVDTINALNTINVGSISATISVMGLDLTVDVTGSINVANSRCSSVVTARLFPPGIEDVSSTLTIGRLTGLLRVVVAGVDISDTVNNIVNNVVPSIINNLSGQINAATSKIVLDILTR